MTGYLPRVVRSRHADPGARACLRVLGTLAELHKAGYQRLRGMPFMSPSGMYWRLWIAPVDYFYRNNGALVAAEGNRDIQGAPGEMSGRLCAAFSTGQIDSGEYFGWRGTAGDDARGLAARLVERKPDLAAAGQGWDYAYAGWWQHLMGLAERGWLPVALADWPFQVRSDRIHLNDMRSDEQRRLEAGQPDPVLPMPPHGGAPEDWEHFDDAGQEST